MTKIALSLTTALAGFLAVPAVAQTAPTPATPSICADVNVDGICDDAAATNADGSPKDEGIVVTGSRIRLPNLSSKEPIVTVGAAYIEDRGLTNVADALNEIPGYRGSVTPQGSQGSFGQGVNFINTYGLGSNRTLTLLNGRRVVSSNVTTIFGNASPGTQVDLNVIPVILVDRIDRVSIGGAPVYGTDAIAGTVNIVLKRKFTGLELRATSAITERGDNFRYNFTGAGGLNFGGGRGNITAAASYEHVDGVLGNSRDFYRANLGGLTNPCTSTVGATCTAPGTVALLGFPGRTPANDGRVNPSIGFNDSATDGFPGAIQVLGVTIPQLSRGGVLISGAGAFNYQFDKSGNLIPYNRGIPFVAALPSGASRSSGGDGFNFNDYIQLTSTIERINANLFTSYELTDNVRFFAEGMFFQGKGDELVQQPTFNSSLFGGQSVALNYQVADPRLTSQAKTQLAALGYTTTFSVGRANADLADATGSSRNRLYRGVAGFDGDFMIGGRKFNFEASVNYGRNDFTDYGQGINQQNFTNAINNCGTAVIVTGTGNKPGTTTPYTPLADSACAPLSLFGEGVASAAAKNYVVQNTITETRLEQFVANVNVGGSPFDLFGNPVAFNAGYEHHTEKGAFNPDPFLVAGLGRSVAIAPTSGKYALDEEFGEVLVPLITPNNDFIFSKLEAYGRVRHVHNTVNGNFIAWAAGGSFAPIPDVEFRGNYTRSFRAPSIVELFSPQTVTFVTVPDLCSPTAKVLGSVPDVRTANCNAFLAKFPTATPLLAAAATISGLNGGNPKLLNERANSFTYGAIVRPRFIPGLAVSVDYISIDIRQPISSLSVATITASCFDNSTFNAADPANGNAFCSLIKRDPTGQVLDNPVAPNVTSGFVNGNSIKVTSIQGTVDYTTKLNLFGTRANLELGGDLFYLRNRLNDITGVAPARSDGLNGDPKWQAQGRFRYFTDSWGMSTNVNYVGRQIVSLTQRGGSPNDAREFDSFEPYATVDASIWIKTADQFRLTLSVTNLFDRIGQGYFGYIIPASINDALGRRFAITAAKKF